jgi:hypothetical protein
MSSLEHLALSIITLFAASVNGALGDGFSSLTVPPALLFLTNRTQPALVLIEVVLKRLRALRQPQEPVAGVATEGTTDRRPRPRRLRRHPARGSTGSIVDEAVDVRLPASTDSVSGRWVWSPALVGPAIRSGIRRRLGCALFGTTISGPPLALLLSNEGYVKNEFRAALGLVRLAESSMTAVAYWQQSNRGCLLVAPRSWSFFRAGEPYDANRVDFRLRRRRPQP